MSSSLAPAAPPDTSPTETTPPLPEKSPSSPGVDEITPTTAPVVSIQVPLPSLSPPRSPAGPAPLVAAFPPVLPVVVPTISPPISPVVLPLPLLTPPQPQPLPQPPVILPTPPVTKDIPTPEITLSPPNISPPTNVPGIVTLTPPSSQPPLLTSPPLPDVSQPGPGPYITKTDPLKPGPSPPPLPTSHIPADRQPVTTKPGPPPHIPAARQTKPVKPGPSSPKIPSDRPTKTDPTSTKTTNPGPPIAASAVFPSQPPIALPVPQTPRGGAWLPDTSTPPSVLPSIPGSNTDTPTVVNNSPLIGDSSNNGASSSSSSSSSLAPAGGGVHQNIEASVPSAAGGSSVFVVGLVVGGVLLLLFAAVFCILLFFCRKKHTKFDHQNASDKMHAASFKGIEDKTLLPNTPIHQLPVNTTTPKHLSSGTFAYDELAAATGGFTDHNLLGQGGFGCVYKGVLPNGKEVAVKQLKMGGDQGEREFRAEVDTISQVHHKHLVSLVGYCISGIERLLVYEFVDNNTLDFHLHGKEQPVMDWPTRLKIAIGSAKGLAYLHEDCSPSIIHRDIKAANILLDFNFEAKVSDFGLAKIFSSTNPSVTHMTTRVVGTFGYLAPEYASSGKVTDKSDVYSYGVVLLELITGRTPLSNFGPATNGNLVNWARPLLAQAIADGNFETLADSRLQNNYNVDEMASMLSCAAACVRLSSWRRPRMSQVIRALEGNLSASELDGGTKAGHSLMHFPYESLDFDARNYIEDMKKMALASSTYSDNTSDDYCLNLSVSSSDTSHHIC